MDLMNCIARRWKAKKISAKIKKDEDGILDEPCIKCAHSFWCDLCNDFHCQVAENGGTICAFELEEDDDGEL